MKILFALAGLHRVDRGAEIAFMSIASELVRQGERVTLIGSGQPRPGQAYDFVHVPAKSRERFERFPKLPALRGDTAWEELTFIAGLLRAYDPADHDVTLTCSYPFTNWALRRPVPGRRRPPHVFVTQNGDWPAQARGAEFRFFGCEGLVCINPDYEERNRSRWRCALIPNGVDIQRFSPGPPAHARFGLPADRPVILMVCAMIASKNVDRGIEAVSRIPDAVLVVAGDGPERARIQELAAQLLPGRFHQLRVAPADMPDLYRTADAFLHLSRDESFGNVYVEAMACGTPVVAYDLPRTRWIVEDVAHLCAFETAEALADTLREAIGIRKANGSDLVRRAAGFAWSSVARQYADFLREIVAVSR